jgi:hypothetical protein
LGVCAVSDVFIVLEEDLEGATLLLALRACSWPLLNDLFSLSNWCLHQQRGVVRSRYIE